MHVIHLSQQRELHIHNDRFSVYSGALRLFSFPVATCLNLADQPDWDTAVTLTSCTDTEVVWQAENTLWRKKEYVLRIIGGCFLFHVRVEGQGAPMTMEYFRGYEGSIGANFGVAGYQVINSQDKDRERSKRLMSPDPAEIIPLRAAPPPTCFPFWNDMNEDWIGIGIAAKAGEHNYQKFQLNSPRQGWNENGCWFTLYLEGYTEIDGQWESPMIWGGFGMDDMDVLHAYAQWQYDNLGFPRNRTLATAPRWWYEPIFCGWGAQGHLRKEHPGSGSGDFANQEVYTRFSDKLDAMNLQPTTIMIDDKWQTAYGTHIPDTKKWPSLRGFADWQHQKGRRVVLWLRCWHVEGLPEDECILVDGKPFAADPTNPKYLARLEKAIHHLLSDEEGCCNCDGFKIDFMDCFPREAGAVAYEKGVFGLEMMHRLFSAIYRYSKAAKADAMINMSSVHPYFAGLCDQFRIHDYDSFVRSAASIMRFRAEFAQAIMPGVAVDMDGFDGKTKAERLHALLTNASLGVPDLYYFPDNLSEDELQQLRDAWADYRAKLG